MGVRRWKHVSAVVAICVLVPLQTAWAQYFGRNKAQYEKFKFEVLRTPHFEIYHYLQNRDVLNELGQASERWYQMHSAILNEQFTDPNPVIFYNHHADFQQTTVVSGLIGIGTGGVTEGLRNRVVMPLTVSNAQTDHVLGHELVHAFQYHMMTTGDSTNLYSMRNIPLWMVEGLAEYMSLGRIDAHTAMWMRDAVLHNDVPSLRDMTREMHRYFPYRFGHAFWAFMTGVYGDTLIAPLFRETAKRGYEDALERLTELDAKAISAAWKLRLQEYYQPYYADTTAAVGRLLFSSENAGGLNVAPVLSPNGRYIVFMSERNVITTDLYLAEVSTGRILKKISTNLERSHIDDIAFLESAGTWSPDGQRFAFVVFSKGRTILLLTDVGSGRTDEVEIPGVEYFSMAAWSPDGRHLALSGLVEGRSDLYLYNLQAGTVQKLTDDGYSDMQPAWSADGERLVFASDRGPGYRPSLLEYGPIQLCVMDVNTRQIQVLNVFPGADNFNPQFSPDGRSVIFLSNADGFRNIFEHRLDGTGTFKLTHYFTGVSGITQYSPAISVSHQSGEIAYNLFRNRKYLIYQARLDEFPRIPVDPSVVNLRAATLPPAGPLPLDMVGRYLETHDERPDFSTETFTYNLPYRPKFSLAYIGGSTAAGVSTTRQGPAMAGGVSAMFTDILNHHQLFAIVQANGEIYDIGGQVSYLNQTHRFNWGVNIGHIPYRASRINYGLDTINFQGEQTVVDNLAVLTRRTFEDQASLIAAYPLSQTRRFEAGASFARYSTRIDLVNNYFSGPYRIGEEREKLPVPDAFNVGQAQIAYVGDNSHFGLTSPLSGYRFRFEAQKMFGTYNLHTLLADYRRYSFNKPVGLAFRALHYGRYGQEGDGLFPLFLGNDMWVRGYSLNSFYEAKGMCPDGNCLDLNQLVGTRIAVANAEVRVPFTGPERLALIKSGIFLSDLVLFVDAGMAWNGDSPVELEWRPSTTNVHIPVFSSGASLRINLFGYAVVEPYVAWPFQRSHLGPQFRVFVSAGGW